MWKSNSLKQRVLFVWVFFFSFVFPFSGWAEHVLSDLEYQQTQNYIRILLINSISLEEKSLQLEIQSEISKKESQALNQQLKVVSGELSKASEKLKVALEELKQALSSVEILKQVAQKLEISPDQLEKILPTLEERVQDWQESLELKDQEIQSLTNKRNAWRFTGIVGIITTLISVLLGIAFY